MVSLPTYTHVRKVALCPHHMYHTELGDCGHSEGYVRYKPYAYGTVCYRTNGDIVLFKHSSSAYRYLRKHYSNNNERVIL